MNEKPFISILIPTYNQHLFISKTIQSVLRQSYKNREIIISDDSENNLTEEIIRKKFWGKVKYIHNIRSKGRVENYRFLLNSLAKGDWILMLDGDDFLLDSHFLEKAVNIINKYKKIKFVFSNYVIKKNKEKIFINNKIFSEIIEGNWLFLNTIFKNIDIPHGGTIYRKDDALKLNFYKFDNISSDKESFLKLCINNKIGFVNTYSYCWYHHSNNISQNIKLSQVLDNLKMYDRLCKFAQNKINILILIFWRFIAKYKSIYGYLKYNSNDIKNDLKIIKDYNFFIYFLLTLDPRMKGIFKT